MSCCIIYRRVQSYGLQSTANFSLLPDTELDESVLEYIARHGLTTGRTYLAGYLKSLGLRIQRGRIRERLARVDQRILPWGGEFLFLVGNTPCHGQILCGILMVIILLFAEVLWFTDACVFSRRIVFLRCGNNNLSQTVLELFQKAIERLQDGLWPSLIRVNYGLENVPVCDGMVEARGEGRGSFLGPSVRNRRIERLMRDIFRCMCHLFYYVFLRNGGYRPASRWQRNEYTCASFDIPPKNKP